MFPKLNIPPEGCLLVEAGLPNENTPLSFGLLESLPKENVDDAEDVGGTCAAVGALVVATLNENGASFLGTSWGTGRFPNPNCGGVACTFSLFPKENTDEVGCFNVPPSGALVCPNPNRPEDAEVGFPVDNSLFFIVLFGALSNEKLADGAACGCKVEENPSLFVAAPNENGAIDLAGSLGDAILPKVKRDDDGGEAFSAVPKVREDVTDDFKLEVVAGVGVCPRVACPVTAGVTFKIFLFAEEPNVNASVPGINRKVV